ncbi:CBO0543 family protein [Ammoniphilus sp. YIM 78166]|uniref:CBO0543 family protein n=1 Tax=Ammoniphilus sp. YIM 78166 TaxID=1644106 RepID=UPI00106FA6C7|nr:CBO0543 family protein [Ammoniphilus sp. YIM 78166]
MTYPSYDEIEKIRITLKEATIEHWLHTELFQFNWWLNLILALLPLFIWWKIVDKSKLFQILTYGLMVGVVAIILNIVGINLVWWGYPNSLLPMIPPIFPFDISIVAVLNMILFQYFHTWKSFLKAKLVLATTYSFIFEPLLVKLGIYQLHTWKYWYSFPIYLIIAVSLKWLVQKMEQLSVNTPKQKS